MSQACDKIFGRIKKLPVKSTLFAGFCKETAPGGDGQPIEADSFELVKVIGLEPEKVFKSLDKYVVKVHKMPVFSNTFDSYESYVPGLGGSNLT